MRVPGYCTGCHRIKQVQVSGSALVRAHATSGVAQGICAACEEAERVKQRTTDWLIQHQRCDNVHECYLQAPRDIRDEIKRLGLRRNAIGSPFYAS